ncbi:MAG: hypothetical protein RLZZ387_4575 [Chloroflexota bacterium]|jgi:sugar transferase (PEP-CTERM/EpsH1 system associated)
MRILYLTNGFPFPLTSGYLRHYFLIRELARQHRVSLLSIVGPQFRPELTEALRPFTERVLTFAAPRGRGLAAKAGRRVRALLDWEPAVRQMRAAAEELTRAEQFDAVLFSGKQTYPALEGLRGLPVIADLCDATSVRVRGRMAYVGVDRLPWLLLEYAQVRRVEQALLRRAEHLLFATCRDRDALTGGATPRATVVPNGVDLDYWRPAAPDHQPGTIVFTGAMDYAPNTDAALYLADEILPLVRRSEPDAQVLIVGRDPPEQLRAAGRRPGVTVTGFVDDVRPYLERAAVFAAPLRYGAGIQNKVLEAMAMEVPVVATPLAADGLRTEEGERPPVVVASDAASFAEALVRAIAARRRDPAPDSDARRFVARHFVWSESGQRLDRVLSRVSRSIEV